MIDEELLRWARSVLGAEPEQVRRLGAGAAAPWLLTVGEREVVLRPVADEHTLHVEVTALALAEESGIPVPRTLAVRAQPPALLSQRAHGSSAVPRDRPGTRLRALGALAAQLHAVPVPAGADLPVRDRPIPGVDFAALRAAAPEQPLLARAEAAVRAHRPSGADGFVHGDLWQGNVVWDGERIAAVLDWDCAGVGPAGVDLGSLRFDAATAFGPAAAADVRAGWERAAGRPAPGLAYWDVVAALSSPPDMAWFLTTILAQGRDDLTRPLLIARRDEFLRAALDRLRG